MGNCLSTSQDNAQHRKGEGVLPTQKIATLKEGWLTLLNVRSVRYSSVNYSSQNLSHPSFQQIEKDIDRTYPNETDFNFPSNKQAFKGALQQIALYFPQMGYIQGINFIVGFFILSKMDKLESIKMFIAMTTHPRLMLYGLYQNDFRLIRLYCQLFWSVLGQKYPMFGVKIKELCIPDELWIFQWFLTLFIYSFPLAYIKDILNFIFEEKQFAMVKIALAVIEVLEPYLMAKDLNNFEDQFVQAMQMLKNEEYAMEHIPIDKLLKKAKKIDSRILGEHLLNLNTDNWLKTYFMAPQTQQETIHNQFIAQLQLQRAKFLQQKKSGLGASISSREGKSATMIDYIEDMRMKRFNINLINSLSNRAPNNSFVQYKKRYSLIGEAYGAKGNNLQLVQSIFMN